MSTEAMAVRYYEFDQFRLTPERYELTRAGRPVRLEKIPFDLLVLLGGTPPRARVSR